MKKVMWITAALAGLALVAVFAGVVGFRMITQARAAEGITSRIVQDITGSDTARGRGPGFPGLDGGRLFGADNEHLAAALGITVEELQAAQETARLAAIDQAVADGWLTEKQAEALKSQDGARFGGRLPGLLGGFFPGGDPQASLAEALGISVDELQAAQKEAAAAALQEAVEAGDLTQEQADEILTRQALAEYLDGETLLSQALGISVDELQTYRQDGKTMTEIVEAEGTTATQVSDAYYTAFKAALAQAVSDGVITQVQADELLLNRLPGGHGGLKGFGEFRSFDGAPDELPMRGERGLRMP